MTEVEAPDPGVDGPEAPDARRQRVEALAEGYLDDLQKGIAPAREEILAANPDIASELDRRLTLMEMLRSASPVRASAGPGEPATSPPLGEGSEPAGPAGPAPPQPDETVDPGGGPDPEFPDQIGPYRILEVLGRGGMGIVYLAHQQEPIQRRVALKLIKLGMDTEEVIARFEAERQALALMNHPAIAQVYEAGATERGRPFFAMEHVAGVPITDYCDKNRLSTRDRLELFLDVCDGVQHAHQKGIIHRDLKPSNILVKANGKAMPKLIDFGVAKAINRSLAEDSVHTEHGRVLGTVEYMPPEQAEVSPLEVDTRADIYALGVILYELLVGATPFDAEELRGASLTELRRLMRERQPPKPSTRLSTMREDSTEVAKRRRTSPAMLSRLIRGDLDWITLKAMEKDRTLRYENASDLRADIERHLRGEAVLATPPSSLYLIRKFVRRHRAAVATAALVAVLLIASTISLSVLYQAARTSDEKADQYGDLLTRVLTSASPSRMGPQTTMLELLSNLEREVDATDFPYPEVEARLRGTLGMSYRTIGKPDRAEPLLRRSLRLYEDEYGADSAETVATLVILLRTLRDMGVERLDESGPLSERVLALAEERFGPDHPHTLHALNAAAEVAELRGDSETALELYREAVARSRETHGDMHEETLTLKNDLAAFLLGRKNPGDAAQAVPLLADVLEGYLEWLPPDHPRVLTVRNNIAVAHQLQEAWEDAALEFREILDARKRSLGETHPKTLQVRQNLAGTLYKARLFAEAREEYEALLDLYVELADPDAPTRLLALNGYGRLLVETGEPEAALPHLRELVDLLENGALPEGHVLRAVYLGTYGRCLVALERYAEAERSLLRAERELEARDLSPRHPYPRALWGHFVYLHESWGNEEKAETYRRRLEQSQGED